ncbi:DNA mismatch repair protein msh6 [Datura stramonium]|uniref:DNA mismatch repair protein n=1 Tax=Datura stramonium TaxID=4076 RepID=A0ABS8RRY3_DATST|nr:DNA mismatch repair protein msh6 [Datura stramonium]
MASSLRSTNGRSPLVNGRSPLVNQQSQITSFFSKTLSSSSPSPSPSPSPLLPKKIPDKSNPKPNPNPKSKPNPSTSPCASPTTPSPLQGKRKIAAAISTVVDLKPSYGQEVVDKRVKVYWPLDKVWYEGCVKSFDSASGEHLVKYDDGDEEMIVLAEEKIEWVKAPARKLRRLRRSSVVEAEEEEEKLEDLESFEDDSEDEDWGNNAAKHVSEDEDVSEDMDLEIEEEGNDVVGPRSRKASANKVVSSKRKTGEGMKLTPSSSKKSKTLADKGSANSKVDSSVIGVNGKEPVAILPVATNEDCAKPSNNGNVLPCGAADRFGQREAEKFPFLGKDRKDANKRSPEDANYDPRTLYLPPNFLKGLTGGQRQWWEFKSKHMDKVLFFKMGKFYELYEMDAHIGAQELHLQYMKGEQPHCGFPEKNFSMNVEKLARKGYRVLVVEQTETPEQLENRRREKGSKDKVVRREICAVVTKGTLTEGEMLAANPDASYLMAVTESSQTAAFQQEKHTYGICMVDITTSKIIIGQFEDDSDCSALCCLLSELRPVEIIKPAKLLSLETERVLLRHTRNPLVNELVPLSEFWDAERTICEVKGLYRNVSSSLLSSSPNEMGSHESAISEEDGERKFLPDVLCELINLGEKGSYALSALGGALYYLKQAFLDESLLKFAKFELLALSGFCDGTQKRNMVLDAAALENLEIFENSRNGDSSGTLYAQINHCITAFGKRMLRSWLARPLYNPESIRERQDAVAGLKGLNLPVVLEFRKELSRLPDMERLLARLFGSSEANGRNANKVILYEDAAKKQLQEFISALRGCESMVQACSSLGVILENTDSKLLHHLLTPGKGLPDVDSVLKHFKDAFDWVEANNSGRIIPHEGVDEEYDAACKQVQEIELKLSKHLKEQRKLLGDSSIDYVTIGKDAYLLEVPESLCRSIPKEYELQSSKKGYFRYWNPVLKKLIGELSQADSEKESKLKSILQRLIGRFCEHHNKWRELVSITAELDVLISLSIASDYYEGPTCRPNIKSVPSQDDVPVLLAENLGHPVLRSDSLDKGTFVSNNVSLGGPPNASFILLTGPNMGGKSTLLRQVCMAVILAQVGADVPASSFDLSPVDRIFVRMGAKDHIMAGQSTFLTELLETASMLSLASRNSLVALDELGRGTSTSDGQAIAESVLEHFVHKVQCRGMFSTHYHRLSIDYQKDSRVSLCHMACQVGKGSGGVEEVTFLYRLTPGACPKSYGVNVARLAGLPDDVLQRAAAKSEELEIYGHHRQSEESPCENLTRKTATLLQNLINLVVHNKCDFDNKSVLLDELNGLQVRARLLLGQN